jgi:glycerol-3-phosphate acyltransferase PlsY
MILSISALFIAYLLGSVSCSILICKISKQPDPREQGSGNAGATNVLRIAGKKLALCTLLGDMAKGLLAVLIGRLLGQTGFLLGLVAFAVFMGHVYPIFFKFKGGKGVATGFGALFALSPILGVLSLVTWGVVAAIFRYSSLASLVSFVLMPFYSIFFVTPFYVYFLPLSLMACLTFWKHRGNISRLQSGTESKIGQGS